MMGGGDHVVGCFGRGLVVFTSLSAWSDDSDPLHRGIGRAAIWKQLQGIHQSQDSKLVYDNTGMRSKRLCLFGNKLSLGCRGSSEAHGKVHLQPRSISSYPSKALPKQQQNPRWDEKQQCDQDYNCGIAAGNNKQKEAKKWAMSEAEAVIVLKSVPARKRMGRWRART
ncbi:hypothetical protein FF1_026249 [Malus domestica]